MNNDYVEVGKNFYKDFLRWGRDNIEGFHYEVVTVADRTIIKNGKNEVLAYRNLAYEETFHIKKDVMNMLALG